MGENQRERARPKPANQRLPRRGKLRDQICKLGETADMYDERDCPRACPSRQKFWRPLPPTGHRRPNRRPFPSGRPPISPPGACGPLPGSPGCSPSASTSAGSARSATEAPSCSLSSSFPGFFSRYHTTGSGGTGFSHLLTNGPSPSRGEGSRAGCSTVTFYSLLPLGPCPFPSPSAGSRCKGKEPLPRRRRAPGERRHRISPDLPAPFRSFKWLRTADRLGQLPSSAAENPIASKKGRKPGRGQIQFVDPLSRAADRARRKNRTPIADSIAPVPRRRSGGAPSARKPPSRGSRDAGRFSDLLHHPKALRMLVHALFPQTCPLKQPENGGNIPLEAVRITNMGHAPFSAMSLYDMRQRGGTEPRN